MRAWRGHQAAGVLTRRLLGRRVTCACRMPLNTQLSRAPAGHCQCHAIPGELAGPCVNVSGEHEAWPGIVGMHALCASQATSPRHGAVCNACICPCLAALAQIVVLACQ